RFDQPLDDGAVRGPGRLRIARAISDPRRTGRVVEKGPKTEAGKRVIALDSETVQAFLAHRELVGGGSYDRIFTSPGGSPYPFDLPDAHRPFADDTEDRTPPPPSAPPPAGPSPTTPNTPATTRPGPTATGWFSARST